MSMTLVDTNVVLDIFTDDPKSADRSIGRLDSAALKGSLTVNDAVYAELSLRFATIEALEAVLDEAGIAMAAMPRAAPFLAGKAFQRYRSAGGSRTGAPPDFFIGAHAAISGWTLLSRDAQRCRTYFSTIDFVTP
jgi:predicted nucleic acid-binding protein